MESGIIHRRNNLCIFGCESDVHGFLYRLYETGHRIRYVFDSRRTGRFYGNRIYKLHEKEEELKDLYFFIPEGEPAYYEARKELEKYGLKEFENFQKAGSYGKKIVVINANCYATPIATLLYSNKFFSEEYYIYDYKPIPGLPKSGERDRNIIEKCDVFIHQDIRINNKWSFFLSDVYMTDLLKKGCVNITIPNLVGFGKIFFPQSETDNNNNADDVAGDWRLFPHRDTVIDKLYEQSIGADKIVGLIEAGKVLGHLDLKRLFEDKKTAYLKREEKWDIKIIEYILNHYKEKRMFWDCNHPVNDILIKISEGILDYLKIEGGVGNVLEKEFFSENENPVYPEVADYLGLSYWNINDEIRETSGKKLLPKMDIKEYVKEYLFWNYGFIDKSNYVQGSGVK